MRKPFILSIYFIADPTLCAGREVADVVAAALRGGVAMVQYRDKGCPTALRDNILHNAKLVRKAVSRYNEEAGKEVPFLINDHVEIAREVGADGVHLGQGDMSAGEAREILGSEAIIGLTAFTEDQIRAVDPEVVDYIGTGPFYETHTKKGKPVLGAEKFAALAALSPVPVVGIGGITPDNAEAVIAAGAQGVAMMRSVSEAEDPEAAARGFGRKLHLS